MSKLSFHPDVLSQVVSADVRCEDRTHAVCRDAGGGGSPDGKRVVVVMPVRSEEAPKIEHEVVFIQNFFDELRRRVPANK